MIVYRKMEMLLLMMGSIGGCNIHFQ